MKDTCVYASKHAQHIHIPLPVRSASNPQYQKHVLNNMKIHTLPNIKSNVSHGCLVVINVRKPLPKTLFNRHAKLLSKDRQFPSTRRPFNATSSFSHNSQNRFPLFCKTIRIEQS